MTVPPFTKHGVLPEGIHEMSLSSVLSAFGLRGAVRLELFSELTRFLSGLSQHAGAREVHIDGSFVTTKEHPSDVDLCVTYDIDPDNEDAQTAWRALDDFVTSFKLASPRVIDAKIAYVDDAQAWLDLYMQKNLSSLYFQALGSDTSSSAVVSVSGVFGRVDSERPEGLQGL